MPRKRKSDQSATITESPTAAAIAEPDHTVPVAHDAEIPGFVERVGRTVGRVSAPDPFKIAGDYLAGVYLFESRQDRQMAIKFDDKPGQDVIDKVKEAGYRWDPVDRVWTTPVREESAMSTRIDAERLYQDVRQMTRQEKGIEAGQDVPF